MQPVATVIRVHRGGCQAVHEDRIVELRLLGRHAARELVLAVGDEVSFDLDKQIVLERMPRRTQLARRRRGALHVIAANMDRLAIVTSFEEPKFKPGMVDRFMLAAAAGGLESILVVNKQDLLTGSDLPEEVGIYRDILPVFPISARSGAGLEPLCERLKDSRTVLAGHSGVGKSSLLNGLEPELRLETGSVTQESKGRHTTTQSIWIRLAANAVVVDTPGIREIASSVGDPDLLKHVYPDVEKLRVGCRFHNCRHDREPDCAVRAAVEAGELPTLRLDHYRRLIEEIEMERRAR